MAAWRTLGSLVVVLAAAASAWAQPYALTESPQAGDCFRYHLEMNLSGELHVVKDDKPVTLKLLATAYHDYPERLLVVGDKGLPQKAARVYETARAVIRAGDDKTERTLRPDRTLVVLQRPADQPLLYSPRGPLTQEELELASGHLDTLTLTGLLPGKEVALQDTWKVTTDVVQALCHLEGVTGQDLSCQLTEVTGDVARVAVTGTVSGIDLGAMVKMTVQARYEYDLKQHRLTRVEWQQKDDRGQGPANPAAVVATTYTLKREPIEQPDSLSDVALVSVPSDFEPPTSLTQLSYRDPKARFDLAFGREWQVVGRTEKHVVLRLLERGDFVAQVWVTPWEKVAPGQHLSPEEFQKAMKETPGWQQEEVLQAGEVPAGDTGRWVYRVSAVGQMDGLKLLQNFYLVAGPNGDQVVLAFTMTQNQAEKLGTRDLSLVGSLEFPPAK